jgi:hypothetical protein
MPTLTRLPNREEVAAHAAAYPVYFQTGGLHPGMAKVFNIDQSNPQSHGGLWFLRDLSGVVRASILTCQEGHSYPNPEGVLAWNYETEQRGYIPEVAPSDIVFAQSLDTYSGQPTT